VGERFSFFGMQGILMIYQFYSAAGAQGERHLAGRLLVRRPRRTSRRRLHDLLPGHQPRRPRRAAAEDWGFHVGFGLAAVGMFVGVVQYTMGRKNLPEATRHVPAPSRQRPFELLRSPVGLSLSTKLAPAKFQTQMVALFFLSLTLGAAMSGLVTGYYDAKHEVPYFLTLGLAAIVVGVVLTLFTKPIDALMSGVH
jgi:dipeptide/tripeptide permease